MTPTTPEYTCACGSSFSNEKELRVHISQATDRWPIHRCSTEHHDPNSLGDTRALRWLALLAKVRKDHA